MPQLKLLEDFIALARSGSFVRAAEMRHVTHPAFGRRIRALEAWAGTPLVDRTHIPVTLTPQGETLFKTACQVVEQLAHVRNQLAQSNDAAHGLLRIARDRADHADRNRHWHDGRHGQSAGQRQDRHALLL
jgi:DNA-binding transcriptional LysR family regulator